MIDLDPTALSCLSPFERRYIRLVHRMNRGGWKRVWTAAQLTLGQAWVRLVTHGLVRVHGLEHLKAASPDRPILFVANHRTYYDMFVVMSQLLREVTWKPVIYFPVQGVYYYQSFAGMAMNAALGLWGMFPPLFSLPTHRTWNDHAVDILCELCREGRQRVIGIHPEGMRNMNPDPWSFERFQPGTGLIIHRANPQVIPVFLAGMRHEIFDQILHGRETIRVHFAPVQNLDDLRALPPKGSTYKAIVDRVMGEVLRMSEEDRRQYAARDSR